MSLNLLEVPSSETPSLSLQYAQAAPSFLKSQKSWSLPYPLSLLFESESQEKWLSYENLFLACLRTGDFATAEKCLTELISRFGKGNERTMVLKGLYREATATDPATLVEILNAYDEELKLDPTLFAVRKRRVACLRSIGKISDAINGLLAILDGSPTDAEAWAELADIYGEQGFYEQAIHCWEEVLVIMPNAWNIQARLGQVLYTAALQGEASERLQGLSESLRRFCRSVELCDDYLRGYYGLKVVTSKLREEIPKSKTVSGNSAAPGSITVPPLAKIEKLHELATTKLAEIVRKSASGDPSWDGYNTAEIAAARQLLDQGSTAPR